MIWKIQIKRLNQIIVVVLFGSNLLIWSFFVGKTMERNKRAIVTNNLKTKHDFEVVSKKLGELIYILAENIEPNERDKQSVTIQKEIID